MSYLVIGIFLLLIVGGFVTFLVLNATKRSNPAATDDNAAPGIGADDESPLGDTPEHAADDAGGHAQGAAEAGEDGRFKRDPIGGEAEAAPFTDGGSERH